MVYRADIDFLEDSNPRLIERTGEEFRRLHRLLESTDDSFAKAARVEWVSQGRDNYVQRLKEAKELADAMSSEFRRAWKALVAYSDAVSAAKRQYTDGTTAEGKLAEVIAREAVAVTPTARAASPMNQWEDLRGTTGVLDWLAETGVDLDAIREDAERHYNHAKNCYGDAHRIESEARTECLADLKKAYERLPDFRGDFGDSAEILKGLRLLRKEAGEAADDPFVQLPGTGPKVDAIPGQGEKVLISTTLLRIQEQAAKFPDAEGNNYWLPSNSDEGRREYISANSEVIKAAAAEAGLPPEMVAGIAWQEVEGDPGVLDDLADEGRERLPFTGDPDQTSMGPLAIQVRRGAEVLGYDPDNLTDMQRDQVESAVKDPAQNIFIASEYLAQLKAESGFADVPPDQLTRAQMQELAARYNGGPYWDSDAAQGYGRGFDNKLDEATEALG